MGCMSSINSEWVTKRYGAQYVHDLKLPWIALINCIRRWHYPHTRHTEGATFFTRIHPIIHPQAVNTSDVSTQV